MSTFPNVKIALQIYLCLMLSNLTGERNFSMIKHLINVDRLTIAQ